MNTNPVPLIKLGPIFVLLDVLTRLRIMNECLKDGVVKPKNGERYADVNPTAANKVNLWMGLHGEKLDKQGIELLGKSVVQSWCDFLLIPLGQLNNFLARYQPKDRLILRRCFYAVVDDTMVQYDLHQRLLGHASLKTTSKKHLEKLFSLSEMTRDLMFHNLCRGRTLDGLEEGELRIDFFDSLGKCGLFWNGAPGDLISLNEIDELMQECQVGSKDFDKFYFLTAQERCVMHNYVELF